MLTWTTRGRAMTISGHHVSAAISPHGIVVVPRGHWFSVPSLPIVIFWGIYDQMINGGEEARGLRKRICLMPRVLMSRSQPSLG